MNTYSKMTDKELLSAYRAARKTSKYLSRTNASVRYSLDDVIAAEILRRGLTLEGKASK